MSVVYEQTALTPARLREALAANFEGFERERRLLRQAPKYGNDHDRGRRHGGPGPRARLPGRPRPRRERVGLDSYLVVIINNWANTVLGQFTGSSAEGRKAGQPLANGNNPSPGSDTSGVTAFLNSITRLDPRIHAGAVRT